MTSPHRVLVVEDHESFRRVLCQLLKRRGDVLIVGEAANGLDAIRLAEALRPDVVLLDIGLPMLSGIEVAGRMRTLVPDAKLIFVTIESSFEVLEQVLGREARGYVYEPRAHRDVLPVLDAIIRGGQFVGGSLERIDRGDSLASHRHPVLFYSTDAVLIETFGRFVSGMLCEGNSVIVAVTEAHGRSLRRELQASRVDVALAIREKRYVPVNIEEFLATVMVDGWPDQARFRKAAGDLVNEVALYAATPHARIAACGECSPTLWALGHHDAAIQLEHLWDEIAKSRQMDILCAYPMTVREGSVGAVRSLCAEHTAVEIR